MRVFHCVLSCSLTLLLAANIFASDMLASYERQPVAACFNADGSLLHVANRRAGSISVVDADTQKVIGETVIGRQLADLCELNQPEQGESALLACDESAHQLLLLSTDGPQIRVRQKLDISPYPVGVVSTGDGQRCYVASLWSRRLTIVDIETIVDINLSAKTEGPQGSRPDAKDEEASPLTIAGQIDLDFAPRRMLLVDGDTKLIVCDSFAANFTIFDVASGEKLHHRTIPGHNIRGITTTADGKTLIVAHQMLNDLAHTVHNDVHWGLLMSNDLRWLPLQSMLSADADLYAGAHMHPLGESNRATADPAGAAISSDGVVVVTLSGVGEVSIGLEDDFRLQRLKVGQHPVAVAISPDGATGWVLNKFDDTLSVIDLAQRKVVNTISLGPHPKLTSVQRGERLFHDGRLSLDGWMSCHSCHTDGHTNGHLNDNLSDGTFGAPKRVLSLLGKADTAPFAWNGASESIEQQIRKSITNTMQGTTPPTDRQVADLASYLAQLPPPPSLDVVRGTANDATIQRGGKLFSSLGCKSCHNPDTKYTSPKLYNVGLKDELERNQFNPPSLVGLSQRAPLFHDGRAKSIHEVLTVYKHKLRRELNEREVADLTSFLRSL